VKRKDGDIVRKPARKCTRDEVVAARNAIGKKKTRAAPPAEAAIVKALHKRKALAGVKVRATKTHASISELPLTELRHAGEALAKLELPD
jgi:hypothetical protein